MRAKNAIYNPKFQFNFNNKHGAMIIAGLLYDGGITKGLFPFYVNNDTKLSIISFQTLKKSLVK